MVTEINKFAFKADQTRLVNAYLRTINGLIGLTNKELEIVEWLIEGGDGGITKDIRKNVSTVLGISPFELNNYIARLRKKGAVLQNEEGMFVNPKLIPKASQDGLSVIIEIQTHDRQTTIG